MPHGAPRTNPNSTVCVCVLMPPSRGPWGGAGRPAGRVLPGCSRHKGGRAVSVAIDLMPPLVARTGRAGRKYFVGESRINTAAGVVVVVLRVVCVRGDGDPFPTPPPPHTLPCAAYQR